MSKVGYPSARAQKWLEVIEVTMGITGISVLWRYIVYHQQDVKRDFSLVFYNAIVEISI